MALQCEEMDEIDLMIWRVDFVILSLVHMHACYPEYKNREGSQGARVSLDPVMLSMLSLSNAIPLVTRSIIPPHSNLSI